MAITNFIPTVWSEMLHQTLNDTYIGVAHCNRDFEGDIRELGNTVKICGIENVTVRNYTKNTDMSIADTLNDFSANLIINNAKYFNFQIDDIDRVQSSPKLMQLAIQNAASALANEADKTVFSVCAKTYYDYNNSEVYRENMIDCLLNAYSQFCQISNAFNNDIVLEVSPELAKYILKAKLNFISDNTETLETGCIGNLAGCRVYVSKNVDHERENDESPHLAIMRTKRAVSFAEQISDVQAYRPERRFADAVKGLHLYGCAITYPKEIMKLNLTIVD